MSSGLGISVVHRNTTNVTKSYESSWNEQVIKFQSNSELESSLSSPLAEDYSFPQKLDQSQKARLQTSFTSNTYLAEKSLEKKLQNYILAPATEQADQTKSKIELNRSNKEILKHQSQLHAKVCNRTSSDGEPRSGFRRRLPQVIMFGVKKCGTKALLTFLSQHPYIKTCKTEIHFFDKYYENGLNWYRSQMPKSYPYQMTIEKSPRYFVTAQVPKRVRQMSAKVKLLVIFRDPLQRAISDYVHIKARGRKAVNNKTFESLVFINNKNRTVNKDSELISTGMYPVHLKKWFKSFSRDQMHFIDGNSLIKNPSKELIDVQKFLKIPVVINEKSFVFNRAKQFYCVYKNSPQENKERIKDNSNVICLGKSKGRPHPYVKPETMEVLREFYKPYNEELRKMTGKDFSWFT